MKKNGALAAYAVFPFAAAFFVLLFGVVFFLTAAAIALLALGLISVPVGLLRILRIFTDVASDLSSSAMIMAGFFCIFGGCSLGMALWRVCPIFARLVSRFAEYMRKARRL